MKCFQHHGKDAVAVCIHCGRGLCADCVPASPGARAVCSSACAAASSRGEHALQRLLDQGAQSARASAFYCHLTGVLSAGAAVAAWHLLPSPFLIGFTAACSLVMFAAGYWHGRVAHRASGSEIQPGASGGTGHSPGKESAAHATNP